MNTKFTSILYFFFFINCSLSAQWTKTAGPPGIRATQFYEIANVLYVGTDAQGVYKSLDHGNTWIPANTGIENRQVLSLTGDGTYIYAGTGATDTSTDGVYRSSNQGATWTAANSGIQDKSVYCLLVAADKIFAGTIGSGVYKSSNQGVTWTNANGDALGSSFIFIMFYAAPRLTVEADNCLYYSEDFGDSWYTEQDLSPCFYPVDQFLQKGDTVLIAARGNVFVTQDGGITWGPVIHVDPIAYDDIEILGLDKSNDTIYAGHALGVYRSTNWGQTWTNIPSSGLRFGNRLFNYNFKISGGNFLLSMEEIGIYKSLNKGVTWSQVPLNQFEAASTIDNSIIVSENTIYSGTHNDGVYSSINAGNTWTKIGTTNPLDTLSNAIIFAMLNPSGSILLAGACGYGLYRSTDNGSTWTHITAGLPVEDGFSCINSLALSGSNVIAATTKGIYYSTNNGLTWAVTNIGGSQVLYSSGLAANGNVACTCIFSTTLTSGIWRSTNSGVTWSLVNNVILDVLSMAVGGTNHFYAGNFDGNYMSSDNGITWTSVGPGIPDGGFTHLAFDNYIFVGNNLGVYYSNNYGATFSSVNTGMDTYPNNSVQGLSKDNTYIYAGTFLNAIWRRPLFDFGIGSPPCSNIVMNTNDSGSGSLRDVVSCVLNDVTITFDAALTDQTITLTSGEIDINKNLVISGLGMTHLTISGNNTSRIFHLAPGNNFGIKDLDLKNANAVTNGGALFVEGHLSLQNVLFQNNIGNGAPRSWTVSSAALVDIFGNVQIQN